jgi:hypothetical protein
MQGAHRSACFGRLFDPGTKTLCWLSCRHSCCCLLLLPLSTGWQFNSQGCCTSIPQIGDAKAEAVACQSKRSRVNAYPVKVGV